MLRRIGKLLLLGLIFGLIPSLFAISLAAQQLVFPDSKPAHLRLEERNCSPSARGEPLACHAGLKGQSAGKTCLMGINYERGQELKQFEFTACTIDCLNPQLRPDAIDDCGSKITYSNSCFSSFANRLLWRSAGDLDLADQKALGKLFDELLGLIHSEKDIEKYAKLGGDARRVALKQQIVQIVFHQMTPYALECAEMRNNAISFNSFEYPNQYEGPTGAGMATGKNAAGPWMNIYENVFYDKANNSLFTPDVLAAAFMHEVVHWKQTNLGYPESRYIVRYDAFYPPGEVEVDLNELMAYDRSRISTFYKIVLTPAEFNDWSTLPRIAYVKRFNADWAKLNLAQQQSIAKWAWGQADEFMRRMMYVYPGEDGGVWGMLCAANKGTGPCGMVK
jgi:hypothetical protein